MKRKDFLKTAGIAAAGAIAAPYILPSGRLFAQSGGNHMAKHVIYVMFAGGVRHQEVIDQSYLTEQGASGAHNLMQNMFNFVGGTPNNTVIYGPSTPNAPINNVIGQGTSFGSIESQGVTFAETNAASRGHYGGFNSLIQGNQAASQGLANKPINPTIFEYLRKHAGFSATDVWFIGNTIANSVPLLNHSEYPGFGAEYGANFFAPSTTFGNSGQQYLSDAKFHPEEQLDYMRYMRTFLDNQFDNYGAALKQIGNTKDESEKIKEFMREMFTKGINNVINTNVPETQPGGQLAGQGGGDISALAYSIEVMKKFEPKFLTLNFSSVDVCHGNYTSYLKNLHTCDYLIGELWKWIQSTPPFKDETIMILSPECGRNLNPNPIKDQNNFLSYDHSDNNALRVFTQIVGGANISGIAQSKLNAQKGNRIGTPTNPVANIKDNVLTIGEIFGVRNLIEADGRVTTSNSLFDYM